MIVGKRFAWGHLGKTGGDATLALFRMFPELIVHADGMMSNAKHDSFAMRGNEIRGKLLFLNIRRLPSWTLSYMQHRARYGLYPEYKPSPIPSPDEIVQTRMADRALNHFIDNGRFKIDRWIRTEFLKDDFLDVVAGLTEISEDKRCKVRELVMVNSMRYDHSVDQWFTPQQLKTLYENNPIWTCIEQEVYSIKPTDLHQQPIDRIRKVVRTILPSQSTVIVVSKGDNDLLNLDVRQAWHFPQNKEGVYAGYHPADSGEAIVHLEEARAKGGEFLLFPGTAFWWLEQYGEFRQHLNSRYRHTWSDEHCIIYQLCPAKPGSGRVDA